MDADKSSARKADAPKRRACDECRTKKLACSKELDGCARCKREGIQCVYSPQKPMGRPRKRTHHEVEIAEPQEEQQHQQPQQQAQQQHYDAYADIISPFDSTLAMELDMSFLDFDSQNMNFFDLVDTNFTTEPFPDEDLPSAPKKTNIGYTETPTWMGDYMGSINFDESAPTPPPGAQEELSPEVIEQIMKAEIPDKMPSLSPAPSTTPSSQPTPSSTDQDNSRCACLSKLYLALDSLQRLPKEVAAAMKVARTASRMAHDSTLCEICGNPPLELSAKPPIAAFQTLMMLGALLPSLSNAYMQILTMVDTAASKADAEHLKMRFELEDYGGLWGGVGDGFADSTRDKLLSAPMEPPLWRLTVRALLKIDVYGMHPDCDMPNSTGYPTDGCNSLVPTPGLKDIITLVEERSRRRHEQLDMALAAGLIVKPEGCDYNIGGEPPCMHIIELAKRSMNNLIIP